MEKLIKEWRKKAAWWRGNAENQGDIVLAAQAQQFAEIYDRCACQLKSEVEFWNSREVGAYHKNNVKR